MTNPPFGMLLNWDGPDRINNNPFVDWLKLASEWQTSGATQMGWADLVANGHITATGAVLSIPAGADNVTMTLLNRLPAGSSGSGRYRLYFTGDGGIGFNGAGSVDWPAAGIAEFNYTADGNSFVNLMVSRVDTGSIHFHALVHEDDWTAYENGETFRREWLDLIRNSRVLRHLSHAQKTRERVRVILEVKVCAFRRQHFFRGVVYVINVERRNRTAVYRLLQRFFVLIP